MKRKILILGANGMLGHTLFSKLSNNKDLDVYGTVRNNQHLRWFLDKSKVFTSLFAGDVNVLSFILKNIEPEYVINCIGVNRVSEAIKNPIVALKINSLFPHLAAEECEKAGCKLINFSSDYVFNGKNGPYTETDTPTPVETFGRTKLMGEVSGKRNTLTIRCSLIGHELDTTYSTVEWFLNQKDKVTGYKNFYTSALTTIEMAKIIEDYVLPCTLSGVMNMSSCPISRFDMLSFIAKIYDKNIEIILDDKHICDSTLNSTKFINLTGYTPPTWDVMIDNMYKDFKQRYKRSVL